MAVTLSEVQTVFYMCSQGRQLIDELNETQK